MIRSEKEYIRLPGGAISLRTRARLYMGKDHLLSLLNTGYTESYKRFYFKDIQAIVAQKTGDGTLWSIVHAIFTVAWILIALIIDEPVLSFVFGWIPAGIFLVLFLGNLLSGPTCVSYIYTAVTKEKLRSLSRLRKAQSVMNTLRPFIDNAQGKFTSEEIRIKTTQMQGKSTVEIKPKIVSRGESETVHYYDGRYHEMLFYVLFLFGLQDFTKFIFNHIAITFLGWFLFWAVGILVIISIVKQHTSIMKKEGWLVGITWATLVYLFIYFNVSYFIIMFASFKNIELMQYELEMIKIFSHYSPLDNFYITIFYIVSIVYAFTSVTLGLILLRRYKHEIARHR
jgi:hypothetical protein